MIVPYNPVVNGLTPNSPLESEVAQVIDSSYDLIFGREIDQAEGLLVGALNQAALAGFRRQHIRALYWLAYISTLRGEHFHAEQRLKEALEQAQAEANPALIAGVHFGLGRIYQMRGQLKDAEDALGSSLMFANNSGDKRRQADAYALIGIVRRDQGLLEDALEYTSAACSLFKDLPNEEHAATETLLDLNAVAFELGQDEVAKSSFVEATELDSGKIHARLMSRGFLQRSLQLLLLERLAEAAHQLELAENLAGRVLDYESQFELELARGRHLHAAGNFEQAAAHCISATRLAQNTQSRFRLAEARLQRAQTLQALGQLEKALAVLSDAEVAFEMFGAQQLLAQSYCVLARFRMVEGRRDVALAALSRARSIGTAIKQPLGRSLLAALRLAEAEVGS